MGSRLKKRTLKNTLLLQASSLLLVASVAFVSNTQNVKAQVEEVINDNETEEIIILEKTVPVMEEIAEEIESVIDEETIQNNLDDNEVNLEAAQGEKNTEIESFDDEIEESTELLDELEGNEEENESTEPEEPLDIREDSRFIWGYFDNPPIHNSQTGRNIAEERDFQLNNRLETIGISADNKEIVYQRLFDMEQELKDHETIWEEMYLKRMEYYNLSHNSSTEKERVYYEGLYYDMRREAFIYNAKNIASFSFEPYGSIYFEFHNYNKLINFLIEDNILENNTNEEETQEIYTAYSTYEGKLNEYKSIRDAYSKMNKDLMAYRDNNDLSVEELTEINQQFAFNSNLISENRALITNLELKISDYQRLFDFLPENYEKPVPEMKMLLLDETFIKKVEYDKLEVLNGEPVEMTLYLENVPEAGQFIVMDVMSGTASIMSGVSVDIPAGNSVQKITIYPNSGDRRVDSENKIDFTSIYELHTGLNHHYYFNSFERKIDNDAVRDLITVIPENIGRDSLKEIGIEDISFEVLSNGIKKQYEMGTKEIIVNTGDVITMLVELDPGTISSIDDFEFWAQFTTLDYGSWQYNKRNISPQFDVLSAQDSTKKEYKYQVTEDYEGEYIFRRIFLTGVNQDNMMEFDRTLGGFMKEFPRIIVHNDVFEEYKPIINDLKVNVTQSNNANKLVMVDNIYQLRPGDTIQFVLDVESKLPIEGMALSYWGRVQSYPEGWFQNFVINEIDETEDKLETIINLEITEEMLGEYQTYITVWNDAKGLIEIDSSNVNDYPINVTSSGMWYSFVVVDPEAEIIEPNLPKDDEENNDIPEDNDDKEDSATEDNKEEEDPSVNPSDSDSGEVFIPNIPNDTEEPSLDSDEEQELPDDSESSNLEFIESESLLPQDVSLDYSGVLLPQTGELSSNYWFTGSVISILLGLGLIKGRKEEID